MPPMSFQPIPQFPKTAKSYNRMWPHSKEMGRRTRRGKSRNRPAPKRKPRRNIPSDTRFTTPAQLIKKAIKAQHQDASSASSLGQSRDASVIARPHELAEKILQFEQSVSKRVADTERAKLPAYIPLIEKRLNHAIIEQLTDALPPDHALKHGSILFNPRASFREGTY